MAARYAEWFNLPSNLVKAVLLSLLGTITPFGLAWASFVIAVTAQDAGVDFVSGVAFGGLGFLMLGSAVGELFDETHRRAWAVVIAVLNGVAGLFAVAIAVRISEYINTPADLLQASLSVAFIAASLLGLLGGLQGRSLKSHETSGLQ